jgi:SAM-dependent methyltransferase
MADYDVESYWSRVGREIAARQGSSLVAGDDNPFFRYKRKKFLKKFLHTVNFNSKIVLEVGCGPGGNLLEIGQHRSPEKLLGVDISQTMIEIATGNLARHNVAAEFHKINGVTLPFADRSIDLSYTVTVLQHNTDGTALKALVREMCRVTRETIVVMEDTGNQGLSGMGSFIARRLDVYKSVFSEHGFQLSQRLHLNTRISYLTHAVTSHLFLSKRHKEGEPIGIIPQILIASLLPVSRILDDVFVEKKGLTKMVFNREA